MSRRTRKTIFYVLLVLFVLIGAVVVFYAQGWRFDFLAWHIEKVGAIYVRSFPETAHIFLEHESVPNQSGFLLRGTLLSNLFPRNYKLTLTEDGYLDWHENAQVLPALVTEFKNAVLVPKTPTVIATDTMKNFFVTSGEVVTQGTNDAILWRGKAVGYGEIVSESADFKNIVFKNAANGAYVLYDFEESTSTNLSALFTENGVNAGNISNLTVDSYDPTKLIAGSSQRIWILDAPRATMTPIERAPAGKTLGSPLAISPSLMAWTRFTNASGTSAIVLYDTFAKTTSVSSSTIAGRTITLKWVGTNLLGALQDDGSLYLYDVQARQFQKVADDVRDFEPAGDGSAIAALEHRSLEILPVTDAQTYHRFNLPDVSGAERVVWYRDMNHLFVIYPGSISFLDLDDLGLQNFVSVAKGTSPLYKSGENILYLINSAQKLEQFDFPS